MAIQGKYQHFGVNMDNAYVRIDEIFGGKTIGLHGRAKLYYNQKTAQAAGTVNAMTTFDVTLGIDEWKPDVNPFPALYQKLKAMDQFKNFTDA